MDYYFLANLKTIMALGDVSLNLYYYFSKIRHDEKVSAALQSENKEELRFHQKCYDRYTHKKELGRIIKDREDKERKEEEEERNERKRLKIDNRPRALLRRRGSLGNFTTSIF